MAKVRTMKRGSRFEFDRPLDARQALADGRGGPWRYAGLGRIPSCSGDEFRFHVVWLREMDLNHRPPGYEPGTLPTALSRGLFLFTCSGSVSRMGAQYAYLIRESQSSYENIKVMKESARYAKIVEWSEEDQCFVGSSPEMLQNRVFDVVGHGNDPPRREF